MKLLAKGGFSANKICITVLMGTEPNTIRNLKESYKYRIIAIRKPQSLNKYTEKNVVVVVVDLSQNAKRRIEL